MKAPLLNLFSAIKPLKTRLPAPLGMGRSMRAPAAFLAERRI